MNALKPSNGFNDAAPDHDKIFLKSSFFKEKRAPRLPIPAEVRAISKKSGNIRSASFNRPPPVMIPSLGLVVKYGADATVAEAQTQIMICKHLKGRVPVPEVFGWTEHGGQVFIYMSLIEGETLQERWGNMNENERQVVCEELKCMVKAWRLLEQDSCSWRHDHYVGKFS